MKTGVLVASIFLSAISAEAHFCNFEKTRESFGEKILEVKELEKSEFSFDLVVTKSTYVKNVKGYACAAPGIEVPLGFWGGQLRHGPMFHPESVTGQEAILPIHEPNMRWCGVEMPEELQPVLKIGNQLPITLKRSLSRVRWQDSNQMVWATILERIESELGGLPLCSEAQLDYPNEG